MPLDFFSFHVYSDYPYRKGEANPLTTMMPPSFYMDNIRSVKQKLEAEGRSHLELHITEWNFSMYDRNLVHDTMFMAPFVIYHALTTLGSIHALAFWTFTDVFEESPVPPAHFYGGFGLVNRDGLRKPGYYAFQLLHQLGDRIVAQGDGYIATTSDDGRLRILLYHYVHVDHLYASGDWSGLSETNRYSVFEERGDKAFRITIEGLAGRYKLTSYTLDREHGSVFDEWVQLGAPAAMTEEEIEYLRGRSGPGMTTEWIDGQELWQKKLVLPPHGVLLLAFDRQY
ncbi:GH39 family glycosyl hydrolase [Paenibacillus sp. SAFN-117]|uniref:GH39 family glycosyl hydrolase n=1 Tax=Paenibacillus sp. SAFN-117 TaxID=3436860 RepID=UPI003F802172